MYIIPKAESGIPFTATYHVCVGIYILACAAVMFLASQMHLRWFNTVQSLPTSSPVHATDVMRALCTGGDVTDRLASQAAAPAGRVCGAGAVGSCPLRSVCGLLCWRVRAHSPAAASRCCRRQCARGIISPYPATRLALRLILFLRACVRACVRVCAHMRICVCESEKDSVCA